MIKKDKSTRQSVKVKDEDRLKFISNVYLIFTFQMAVCAGAVLVLVIEPDTRIAVIDIDWYWPLGASVVGLLI